MNFKRKQTAVEKDHPVRFYKIVALTFLVITLVLFGTIVFMSSKRAVITVTTKAESIEVQGTIGVNTDQKGAMIPGVVVTTTVSGEQLFQPTGTRTEDGVATGVITVHNETAATQPLVATTRFLNEDGVLFRLKHRVTVPANGTIEADVYADQEGPESEIGPSRFIIPGLSAAKQDVIYGTSEEAMTGGTRTIGVLSDTDVENARTALRDRLLEDGKAALLESHPDTQGVFRLDQFAAKPDAEIGTEVSGFTLAGDGVLSGVLYDAAALGQYADDLLQTRSVDNASIIKPADAPPAVSLASVDTASGTAALDVVYSGIATLNPDGNQLDKLMFFGKTKEEVRRYLLSLGHVFGVDIEFRPAWMRTVPHVADHIRVVVKHVE